MIDSWELSPAAVGWGIVGVALFAVVGFVVWSLIGGIVLGLFLYYALRPAYQWVNDRTDHPDLAATATLMLVGVPLIAVLGYAILVGIRELGAFLGQAGFGGLRSVLSPYVDISRLTDPTTLVQRFDGQIPRLVGVLQTLFLWGIRIFVAVVVAFYLLRDDFKIAAWGRRSFPGDYGVVGFLEGVDDDLTTIYTGNLITIALTGLIAAGTYYLMNMFAPTGLGIAFPVLLGFLTGVATLIPAVGMKIVYPPYAAYLAWRAYTGPGPLWFPAVFLVVTFVVVDSFPDIFIRSYISKGEINMGLIMLSYVLGAIAFGWYGVFLAPVLLVVFLHFAHRIFPHLLDPANTRLVTDDWPE